VKKVLTKGYEYGVGKNCAVLRIAIAVYKANLVPVADALSSLPAAAFNFLRL